MINSIGLGFRFENLYQLCIGLLLIIFGGVVLAKGVKNYLKSGKMYNKKTTDIKTLADAVFGDFYSKDIFDIMKKLFVDFVKDTHKQDIDETTYTKMYNEWIILRLALDYNMPIYHYNDHPKIKEIVEEFRMRSVNILLSLYGKDHLDFMKNLFVHRRIEYYRAFSEENPCKEIATLFRFIIELIIMHREMDDWMMSLSTAKQWVSPLWDQSMRYVILIGELMNVHQSCLNKWSIE